jgi:hypothetical protein
MRCEAQTERAYTVELVQRALVATVSLVLVINPDRLSSCRHSQGAETENFVRWQDWSIRHAYMRKVYTHQTKQ